MRVLILILTSLLATNALADTPFYVGGGYGWAKLKQDGSLGGPTEIDDESGSYTLFAGFEFNDRIAFEGGYIDFGDTDDKASETSIAVPTLCTLFGVCDTITTSYKTKFEADGWYINAQYHFPVGNSGSLDILGGFVFGDSKTTNIFGPDNPNPVKVHDSSTDKGMMFGLAYTYQLNPTLYLRGAGNYYKLDFDNVIDDPYRFSLDLIWDF
jgi:hypothetical protein